MPPRNKPVRRKKTAPGSVGLTPAETKEARDATVDQLSRAVEADGGAVLSAYRDPGGGSVEDET